MPAVPETHDFADSVATSSEANAHIRDPLEFSFRPPIAELRQVAAQTFTSGVLAAILWDTADVDTDIDAVGGHDPGFNPSRYTARYPGWYSIAGAQSWASNSTGVRQCIWRLNGTDISGGQTIVAAGTTGVIETVARSNLVYLSEGDYIELFASQNSGGNLASAVIGGQQPHMTARWVSL